MTTIVTIQSTDQISSSRADINTNFANLNSDKIETSVLDTDTTLAANSDSKIPSQKAVKAYVDAGGNVNASETAKGIVEEATTAEVNAGTATGGTNAKLIVTPEKLMASRHSAIKSVTAGATINGATLPVPVYQKKTDNEFYACDANDTAAMKFSGFAVSNGTDGASMIVQFTGIVGGFSGLDEGEKYYLSDTAGTISNAPGTNEVLVGVAISQTELLIQKGRRYASGTLSLGVSVSDEAITTGFRPSRVRIVAYYGSSSNMAVLTVVWDVTGTRAAGALYNEGSAGESTTDSRIRTTTVSDYVTVGVGSITDTGFTITLAETGSIATGIALVWEAEGEL